MPMALIIDDEVDLCRLTQMTLKRMNIESMVAYDFMTATDYLAQHQFDFCLTDLRLPDGSGLDIVKLVVSQYPQTPIAVISAHGNMDIAIDALKMGAFDFVNKPLELPRLRQLVENALQVSKNTQTQQAPDVPDAFAERLIGRSKPIQVLKQTIQKLARSQAPVFLWGESGTGKEVVAKLIHDLSPRSKASFVPVNCGAIPSELMESEFFGHKKGSFTGATTDKEGLFQQANGGTLFLDEVADLPLPMQVKLLRAIQEKKVRPIGGTQEIPVDIRLLSATHKNLARLVDCGDFRQDLYYRINVIEVKLPSLNDRKDDVILLANHFLQLIANDWGLETQPELTQNAQQALLNHHYSGNVRELRNILERAITLSDGHIIDDEHLQLIPTSQHSLINNQIITDNASENQSTFINQPLQPTIRPIEPPPPAKPKNTFYNQGLFDSKLTTNPSVNISTTRPTIQNDKIIQTLPNINGSVMTSQRPPQTATKKPFTNTDDNCSLPPEGLEEFLINQEKQLIISALNQSGWNKTQAAKLLNTTFRSLRYRMKKLEIDSDDD